MTGYEFLHDSFHANAAISSRGITTTFSFSTPRPRMRTVQHKAQRLLHGVQGLDSAGHGLVAAHRRVGRAKQVGLEVPALSPPCRGAEQPGGPRGQPFPRRTALPWVPAGFVRLLRPARRQKPRRAAKGLKILARLSRLMRGCLAEGSGRSICKMSAYFWLTMRPSFEFL